MLEVLPLGQGLWQLVLPLPIPRLPSVNCYAFEGTEGLTLIDPGGGDEAGYQALGANLAEIGFSLADIRRMAITHLHPDHMGLATRLHTETGAEYTMHSTTAARIDGYNDWGPIREYVAKLAEQHGSTPEEADVLRQEEPRPDWAPTSIVPTEFVDDGDVIAVAGGRTLEVVHTPGHDTSHICFLDSQTHDLFTGDHVLPRITPFVPFPPDEPDNLGTYLASLHRVEAIEPHIAYPAHGDRIERGAARANQIALHHSRRLLGMLEQMREGPRTAWQVMNASFKPNMPPMQTRLALQETLAHLEYLRMRRQVEQSDHGGVVSYRRT